VADVLEFPSREKLAYDFLSRELGELLRNKGADEALIEHAQRTLVSVYGDLQSHPDLSFSVELPGGITLEDADRLQQQIAEGVEHLRQHHHSLMLRMAAQLLLTELRLFQTERQDD
jgi:hypothetical protein